MPTPTRILLIDADPASRAALEAALAASSLDYMLIGAQDGEAGLAAARADNFDCVLLNSRLPGVSLPDYIAELCSAEGGSQAIVLLTDDADHDGALGLLRAGALDLLSRAEADSRTLARAIRYAKARRGFVVALHEAREDAEAKSRALDRLNRQSTLILSIIAHDLRNPFQVLLGMSEVLVASAGAGDAEKLARRAAVVNEAAIQANGLMESLFAWASLHMDARADPAPMAVAALFETCAAALQESADTKGVTLVAQPIEASVVSQEGAAAAILRNLVANALKFTESGGQVTLSAERRDRDIALCVADTGVGMTEAQAARLFQLQSRSTSAGTAGESGGGLGLLLCRDLAEWVGGALEVESRFGAGTTFRLVLPAA